MLLGQDNNSNSGTGSLISFALLGALFIGYIWFTMPSAEEQEAKRAEAVRLEAERQAKEAAEKADTLDLKAIASAAADTLLGDSAGISPALVRAFGDFAYSGTLPSAANGKEATTIENDVLIISVANKGGVPSEVTLKKYDTYWKKPLCIVKDGNADFNMTFYTSDGRRFDTRDMYFEPSVEKDGENQVLSMKLKASEDAYLEYRYVLRPGEYMLDYTVLSKGLSGILKNGQKPVLDWSIDAFHTEKGLKYENQYTYLAYAEGAKQKEDNLSMGGSDEETINDLSWFAFKQQFFSTILLTEGLHKATLKSQDISADSLHTKNFSANVELSAQDGDFNMPMKLYFGPNHFHTLEKYGNNIDELVPLGWGIFGWINRWFVIPMFDLLFYNWGITMGIVIIIMTLVIKLILSFFTYSGYKSQAKMRLLKPEMEAINQQYKDADPAKRQQATMELYSKAGVNPLAGCLPILLQMPVLIAMYRFFPASIELRGQSFLWADDLSAYDSILNLPFNIPLYGDHVSLFALLMALTLLIQTKMAGGGMDQPSQPGMPNMKFMLYLMPVMMLLWFNTAASGLSYYYTVSTLIAIIQFWVIKKYIINEDKLHAKIQENKQNAKTKGPSKWQRKMDEMMKQAQEQQNRQQRRASGKK
ncbi:MAG: membrane protein insertase YidC [Flavobacteriales bacterium]|nr:MAG: membrane protein insertase YidC [Flavobacteriales bacterium]